VLTALCGIATPPQVRTYLAHEQACPRVGAKIVQGGGGLWGAAGRVRRGCYVPCLHPVLSPLPHDLGRDIPVPTHEVRPAICSEGLLDVPDQQLLLQRWGVYDAVYAPYDGRS